MRLLSLALLCALALSCVAPDQADPARYGTHTIAFANAWSGDHVASMAARASALDHLGPAFTIAGHYDEDDCHGADYCVRHWDSGALTMADCARLGSARWHVGTGDIDLDPVCVTSELQLQTAFEHEIGHALGMRHVCTQAGEAPDCDLGVGLGYAVMNPGLVAGDDTSMEVEDYAGTIPTVDFTALDLAEFRAVHP